MDSEVERKELVSLIFDHEQLSIGLKTIFESGQERRCLAALTHFVDAKDLEIHEVVDRNYQACHSLDR